MKILLAEDDPNFGSVLKDYLSINGYTVILCTDGESASNEFEKTLFDLCIVDVMLPLKDGFALAREINLRNSKVPFIFLTAKTMKADVLQGYQIGAEDYISKPFDSEVLLYKIKIILSRGQTSGSTTICKYNIGKYEFDIKSRTIILNDKKQKLSPKEAALLNILCENANEVLRKEKALKEVWGNNDYFSGRSMDVYVTKLRKYLKEDTTIEIENIHGTGYILRVPII